MTSILPRSSTASASSAKIVSVSRNRDLFADSTFRRFLILSFSAAASLPPPGADRPRPPLSESDASGAGAGHSAGSSERGGVAACSPGEAALRRRIDAMEEAAAAASEKARYSISLDHGWLIVG
eukprot:CAMPEP_0184713282 /NCGR_PEP_ID=MMETSP0314-20130426/3654_1 /TAXON_ID=38298 /ORGANISM="Rhodella maculata, Strain CCMP 736" /LENGTH=123 /DNA_ID=CAMNT_0027175889 /DNA_START=73 /DNA_END=444 /DNA_ORIENTATION=+